MSSDKKDEEGGGLGCLVLILAIAFIIWFGVKLKNDSLDESEYQGYVAGRVGISQDEYPKSQGWKERFVKGWERGNSERKGEK